MELYNYMKIKNTQLRDDAKFANSAVSMYLKSRMVFDLVDVHNPHYRPQEIDADFMEYQLSEIQKYLTRAKKSLREIIENNNKENKNEE